MRKSGKLAKKGFSCVQVHPFSQEDLDDQISGNIPGAQGFITCNKALSKVDPFW